ncbi:MAG TPA: membrane protein insertion efficiency factor YidD [Gammaproteobacteria bacterium]|nr:membrane protein insertion efficiency factor YidD [Gammaproteobacteria bacterium]
MMIQCYRFMFRAMLSYRCRFEPSCSTYAIEAINNHGCIKGCYLASWRLLRCHPWHPGGLDPVP